MSARNPFGYDLAAEARKAQAASSVSEPKPVADEPKPVAKKKATKRTAAKSKATDADD